MNALNSIRALKAVGPPKTPEQKKLMNAAKEFEAVMLGMVFKQMQTSSLGSDPLAGGQAGSMYREMLADERAKAMSNHGGLGLADGLYRQLVQVLPEGR